MIYEVSSLELSNVGNYGDVFRSELWFVMFQGEIVWLSVHLFHFFEIDFN